MKYRRFMAFLLTGVLAAGLAAAPAQVRAEETGENPVQEEVPGEKEEEKTGGEKASEEEKKAAPAEAPAEKPEEKEALAVPEKKAEEENAEAPAEAPAKAPAETPAEDLSESPAGGMRLLLAAPGEPGEEESGYIYYDEIGDLEMVPGQEGEVYLGGLVAVPDGAESEEEIPLEVTGITADDPDIAETLVEGQDLFVKGKSIGSTRVRITYEGPEGKGETSFKVTVKEIIYSACISPEDDVDDGRLDPGSSTGLHLDVSAIKAGEEEIRFLDEDEVTVVWDYDFDNRDIFSLEGQGFSAVLKADGDLPYHENSYVTVTAKVYLGSEVSEENLITSDSIDYVAGDFSYDWDAVISASEDMLFDEPASESVITVYSESGDDLTVKKWVAVLRGEDGTVARVLEYPFGDPGTSLRTTVNGKILGDLVSEDATVEIFAVVGEEDGRELTTDSVYIDIIHSSILVNCDLEEVKLLPGEEEYEEPSITADVRNMEYPYGETLDCEILGAKAEDPSVAEVRFEEGRVYVKGLKTGTTQALITYEGPDGEEGQSSFTVTVQDVIYYVDMEDSYEDFDMLTGDSSNLKVHAYRYAKDGDDNVTVELEEDEIDVVWELEPEDEEIPVTDFTLKENGTAAVLRVEGSGVSGENAQTAVVRATVYLKETGEEIGSFETEHRHSPAEDFLMADNTMPEDGLVEKGESFTISPRVVRREELSGGGVSEERVEEARFGLLFDPAKVRVTDQNGKEVKPAETDEDDYLVGGEADGTVYTVTRLSGDFAEIILTAVWPGGDDDDPDYRRSGWKYFDLGSLEEEEPGEPENGQETSSQEGSGRDKGNTPSSSSGKSGKTTSSSGKTKTSGTTKTKTSGTTKTSRTGKAVNKTRTGDESGAGVFLLLMAVSLACCAAAAGSMKKKTR